MRKNKDLDPQIESQLRRMKTVPEREPGAARRGRARFLAEASSLRPLPVVKLKVGSSRRFAWRFALASLVVLALVFGGSVGVVQASRNALPGETLYPVKLLSEDLRLGLTSDAQNRIDLLMRYSDVRIDEMNQLTAQNTTVPVGTTARLESQVQQVLQLAAGLGDEEMQSTLMRIRARLEEQYRNLVQSAGEAGEALGQVHQMYQVRLQWIEEGLGDQEMFRNRMGHGQEDASASPIPSGTITPASGEGQGGGSTPGNPTHTPGQQHTPDKTPGPTGDSGPPAWSGGPIFYQGFGSGGKKP